MKKIITTPIEWDFTVMIVEGTKLEDYIFYKALKSNGKHLYIEYDENNDNFLKSVYDLDSMGLSHIKSVEEFDKYIEGFKTYQYEADKEKNYEINKKR